MYKSILGAVVIIEALILITSAEAVTTFERTYGGTGSDSGNSVQETRDGGYIIVGSTLSFGAGNKDVYLIRTDAAGDTIWTQTYGGTDNDYGNSVQETRDGGFIITGTTSIIDSESFDDHSFSELCDIYLIKTDAAGDTLWTHTYSGSEVDVGNSVQETQDGGYIIAGSTLYFDDYCNEDVYLIKTDAAGDIVWTQTYGGTSDESGVSVQETQDGGYIIAGSTLYFDDYCNGDVYLIKTDAQGNTEVKIE